MLIGIGVGLDIDGDIGSAIDVDLNAATNIGFDSGNYVDVNVFLDLGVDIETVAVDMFWCWP